MHESEDYETSPALVPLVEHNAVVTQHTFKALLQGKKLITYNFRCYVSFLHFPFEIFIFTEARMVSSTFRHLIGGSKNIILFAVRQIAQQLLVRQNARVSGRWSEVFSGGTQQRGDSSNHFLRHGTTLDWCEYSRKY